MADVPMPRLSDSMTEGTIVRWLHAAGAEVQRGDDLVEIETDKATVTCEADDAGTLEILAAEGATLPIGTPIARLAGASHPASPTSPAPGPPTHRAHGEASVPGSGEPTPSISSGTPGAGPRMIASPLARRLARERGVDLATLQGTGPGGRIVRADIDAAAGEKPGEGGPPRAAEPSRDTAPRGAVRVERPRPAEQVVIRRMIESAAIPQFALTTDVDMEACARLRTEIADAGTDPAPTFNDFVVKACALALREFPYVNAGYVDGAYSRYERINVGVAVDREGDLIVPTVFDADRRTLTGIARATHTLAERVRTGAITPAELDGGTFSISNLGMYGVAEFAALIHPPQAAILAVGEIRTVPAFENGQVVPRRTLRATVSCDHRIVYGARAAKFLARVRELLERPIALLTTP